MYCTVAARHDSLMSDPQARRLGSLPHTSISYKPCSRKRIPSGALLSIQILALQIMLQIISIINNQHHYHLTKSFKKYWKSVHNRCARVIYTPWWHMAYDIVTIWQFDWTFWHFQTDFIISWLTWTDLGRSRQIKGDLNRSGQIFLHLTFWHAVIVDILHSWHWTYILWDIWKLFVNIWNAYVSKTLVIGKN